MGQKQNEAGRVILGWTVANLLGVAAIGVFYFIPFLTSIHSMLVSSLIIGLPIGFAQWIALRRIVPVSILWILTISAGLPLGLMVINSPLLIPWRFLDDESILSLTLATATIGLFVGLTQWFFLRSHISKSLVWPLSSAVGLGLGICLVLVSNLIDQSGIISIILVVLVYAIATGFVIAKFPVSHSNTENKLVNAA